MAKSPYPRSDREVINKITRSPGGKAGYKQLVREFGLGGGRERRLLVEQLTRIVARGELTLVDPDTWTVPRSEPQAGEPRAGRLLRPGGSLQAHEGSAGDAAHPPRSGRDRFVSGRLDLHRDGFGFVRPDGGGGDARFPATDIFIPPTEINGAMQGDLVLVDEAPIGHESRRADRRTDRRSGRIARVLTRRNPTVVGIFHYGQPQRRHAGATAASGVPQAHGNYITPLDERMGGAIEIPEGGESEGGEIVPAQPGSPHRAGSPHRTVGNEARPTARSAPGDAPRSLEGLAVDVEITGFPLPGRPARGRIIEVLGHPDDFGVDVEIVIRKHGIPHTFPPGVLTEAADRAQDAVAALAPEELAEREDFRGLPIVTIDGETARDFDDAVLVRPLANGNTELQVHIADVSSYVIAGSALDTEARVRGTSVYFPDRAVPMLPHALSSGMCSLLPGEDRLVLSCIMEIDARGEVAGYRVAEGIIRSARRMTYTAVQRCLNAAQWNAAAPAAVRPEPTPEPSAEDLAERERLALEHPELPAAFDAMLKLALQLNAKRVRRGSIDFDLPEPIVEFDPEGNMKAIVRSERGWAHRLIEEFMLSANECVAAWLESQGIPSIYRIHEMPDPKRIVEFEETAASFGQSLGIGNLPVRKLTMKSDRRDMQRHNTHSRAPQRHEIPERIPVTPQMYQRLVRRIAGHPEERILAYLMLRSLKQARYAEKNEGHFALASPSYTHFTSPIRRYPDLIVHRLVRTMLRRGADPRGGPIRSTDAQPWGGSDRLRPPHVMSSRPKSKRSEDEVERPAVSRSAGTAGLSTTAQKCASARDDELGTIARSSEPISAEELSDIAVESSQAERRAADAERELIEWKKMRFMADKIGDDFQAIILSVTKYGFFVELHEMFIEGLVPIASLVGDYYTFRDTDRSICGARTGHCFQIGQHVEVLLDRIDRQQRRLQFALLPGTEPQANTGTPRSSLRAGKSEAKKNRAKVSGKAKKRQQKNKRR